MKEKKNKKKNLKDKSLLSYYGFTKAEQKKYPVVSGILKELTPERIKKEIEVIQKVKLPPELQKWMREYEKVGERNEFIWKWIYSVSQIVAFPISEEQYKESLFEIKTSVLVIFGILLNDVADKFKNRYLLNELLKSIFFEKNMQLAYLNQKEKKYLLFTNKFWNSTLSKIKQYPRYKELKDVFNYDILQILVANQYDYLVSKHNYLVNKTEDWLYPPHTMGGMICGILDILCSPKFDIRELNTIREITWEAQKMARIGNWISTWEREIDESDFTSIVFICAIDRGLLTISDLKIGNRDKIVEKIKDSKIERNILKIWDESYKKINKLCKRIKSADVKKFPLGLKKLLILEVSSRGLK